MESVRQHTQGDLCAGSLCVLANRPWSGHHSGCPSSGLLGVFPVSFPDEFIAKGWSCDKDDCGTSSQSIDRRLAAQGAGQNAGEL